MPYAQDVHIDQALTTLSIAYTNDGYVGDSILPAIPVDNRSDRYFIYGKEAFTARDDLVRPGAVAPEWQRTLSQDMYSAERHAQRQLVTDDERHESDAPLDPDIDTTEFLTEAVVNNREFAILSLVTNPAQVTQNLALSGTSQWSDYTNSVPLSNIKTAKTTVRNGVLKPANMMSISYDGALTLADHPSIKQLIVYTDPNNISDSGLPRIVRGLTINEAGAFQNTANDGQTPTLVTAFGHNVLIHYTSPSPGRKTISFGYTMEAPDATSGVRGFATLRYRIDERHGDMIEVGTTYALKIVATLGAYLLSTVF